MSARAKERFARWIGGEDWHAREALDRLFGESERVGTVERPPLPTPPLPNDDTGVGPAPPETVALWVKLVTTMGPDELADFEARTMTYRWTIVNHPGSTRRSAWPLLRYIRPVGSRSGRLAGACARGTYFSHGCHIARRLLRDGLANRLPRDDLNGRTGNTHAVPIDHHLTQIHTFEFPVGGFDGGDEGGESVRLV